MRSGVDSGSHGPGAQADGWGAVRMWLLGLTGRQGQVKRELWRKEVDGKGF